MTVVSEVERGPADVTGVAGAVEGKSPRQLFWIRFKRDKAALGGLTVVVLLILIGLVLLLIWLALILPSLAVTVRRFHDIGQSGWMGMWGR